MSIRYTLRPFAPGGKTAFTAHVQYAGSLDLDDIVEQALRTRCGFTRAALTEAVETITSVCENMLLQGFRINLGGLVELEPTVRGAWAGSREKFDASRHSVSVNAIAGERVKQTVGQKASLRRVTRPASRPNPVSVLDSCSGAENAVLTAGGGAMIRGKRLKVDPEAADEGVFLVYKESGAVLRCPPPVINKPGSLLVQIPREAPAGPCTLEVRARMPHAATLTTGALHVDLAVLSPAQLPQAA